jgi:hypothetical protein
MNTPDFSGVDMGRILLVAIQLASSVLISFSGPVHATGDVVLVTALRGGVSRVVVANPNKVEAFVKLKEGDILKLDKDARIRLVYFESGRQEVWSGEGRLEIAASESKGIGLAAPEVKWLPAHLVKQIAKTPMLDSQGRSAGTRMRAIEATNTVAKLETEYDRIRIENGGKDLNAEIYLLSGLFELRELDRVESLINEIQTRQKDNMEAMILVSLYRKALKSARVVR